MQLVAGNKQTHSAILLLDVKPPPGRRKKKPDAKQDEQKNKKENQTKCSLFLVLFKLKHVMSDASAGLFFVASKLATAGNRLANKLMEVQ